MRSRSLKKISWRGWRKGRWTPPERGRSFRQERVIGRIVELKAETATRAVKIVLPDPVRSTNLPAGVSLQPGILTVSFNSEEQLLERLFLLARSFAVNPQLLSNLTTR